MFLVNAVLSCLLGLLCVFKADICYMFDMNQLCLLNCCSECHSFVLSSFHNSAQSGEINMIAASGFLHFAQVEIKKQSAKFVPS